MTDFDRFRAEAAKSELSIAFEISPRGPSLLSNEALFHIPLLACAVLTLAKQHRKPRTAEIGQIVGECIERSFSGFKGSSQRLGWSANLRLRTVAALGFLEMAGYVQVSDSGLISATEDGRSLLQDAFLAEDDLSYTLSVIGRSYRDICGERRSQMELL